MESSFESVFWKVGPLAAGGMSLFATVTIYAKSKHPRSPIGRYMSSDICVFYQLWVHNICNVIFIAISVPQVHHFFSCNLCKWLVLYFGVINMLSQFPSVLDCTIRTNDTPFYEQFHSVSPYTHLLMIVMCTWVPFLSTLSVKSYYPQNALDPTRCDVIVVSPPFWMFMLRGIVMLAIACCYLYTIVIIIYRNERIPRAIIRHLNHIMLARILILLALIILLSVSAEMQRYFIPVFEAMVPLPRSMASFLLALQRSCHDLGKDTMAMQDRAKANHD